MSATYRSPVVITVTSRLHVTKAALPASAKKFLREKLFILNSGPNPKKWLAPTSVPRQINYAAF